MVMVRMPRGMLARIDRWMKDLNVTRTGPQWTRSAIIHAALTRALDERGDKGAEP